MFLWLIIYIYMYIYISHILYTIYYSAWPALCWSWRHSNMIKFLIWKEPARPDDLLQQKANGLSFRQWNPPSLCFGPRLPTQEGRCTPQDESVALADLAKGFRPRPSDVCWIESHLAAHSVEGPREANQGFWTREALLTHQQSHPHATFLGHDQYGPD